MAFFSQQQKADKLPALKALTKEYGVKASFSIRDNMVFVCTISSSPIDFGCNGDSISISRVGGSFKGEAKEFLDKLCAIMMDGNHNNSDPMRDYFDVGWYVDIRIGTWNKPYTQTDNEQQ